MHYGEFNLAYALWAIAILICFACYRNWRRKHRDRRFIPRIRYHPEARTEKPKAQSGFYVCPDCGLLADQKGDCPECSDVKPTCMVPGDPDALELYLERQKIFYGESL